MNLTLHAAQARWLRGIFDIQQPVNHKGHIRVKAHGKVMCTYLSFSCTLCAKLRERT